ncbi:MAG: hypothetical protein ACFFG0_33260 [Candidatus Thorarchaeota archaeon]
MAKFKIKTIIKQPLDIVWNAFIDQGNMIHWTKYLEKVEVIKGPIGVGAISHLHYLEKGRPYVLEDKMLHYEEKKKIVSQVSGQGMIIQVETSFDTLPEGTNISMEWDGSSKSLFTRIILRLMQSKIAKQAESELNTFKSLVETYGAKFPDKD